MLLTSNPVRGGRVLWIAVLGLVLGAGPATAECLPGQMQEANLAYRSAAQFLEAQQWDQAIARLQSIVQVCPEHVEATRGIGTAFLGKGDYPQSIQWYRKVIEIRGDEAEAGDFANLAKAYAKNKMYKEARAEYMKAEILAPDDCGVLFNLGVMHYASGYHVQSVEVLEHAMDVCPQIRDHALKQLAKSAAEAAKQQRRNGNNERAQFYEKLAMQYGSEAGGSTVSARIREKMDARDYAGAAQLAESTLEQNPDQPNIWLTMARAKDAMGDKSGAIAAFRGYLERRPDNVREHASLIQVLAEAKRCDEAIAAAKAAEQRFAPQGRKVLGKIWYTHGMALECAGQYEAARAKYAQAAGSGDTQWARLGRASQDRMANRLEYEEARRKKARQGG